MLASLTALPLSCANVAALPAVVARATGVAPYSPMAAALPLARMRSPSAHRWHRRRTPQIGLGVACVASYHRPR